MLEQNVALNPFPALAGSGISLARALNRLANPNGCVLDESRLAAFDPSSVFLTSQPNRILRLVSELLAGLQVLIELGQRQQRPFGIFSPDLLPLSRHQQRQASRSEELQDPGSAQSSPTAAKMAMSRRWRWEIRRAVGRKPGFFVHCEALSSQCASREDTGIDEK